MASKYHSDTQAKIENTTYIPILNDTSDLETTKKTITTVSEASGPGNADYSHSINFPAQTDARIIIIPAQIPLCT